MITIKRLNDINWDSIQAVAYGGEELQIDPKLLTQVTSGRELFEHLIANGVPCYGVTTGLGQLVTLELSDEERADLPHNILRARAAAVGEPLPRPVVRAMMMIRLVNFLSGMDGVTAELCQFLVDRLNDGMIPWVPSLGHGMGADATAHTHAFQTFIGEGFVMDEAGEQWPTLDWYKARGIRPLTLGKKEGLALLNGISAAPALALDAYREVKWVLDLATAVSAISCEGGAVPKDSFHPKLKEVSHEAGTNKIIDQLQPYFKNSQITPYKLQSAISFRVIPQVHGALLDALSHWRKNISTAIQTFSDNPLMLKDNSGEGGQFLSVGLFHNQHLVNQAEHIAVALTHVGTLSTRRLHRLLSQQNTGLSPQLAGRPGLDAGLVVVHKAAIGIEARLKMLANPVSIFTSESSAGQEDYMSMAIPTISRLYEMNNLVKLILAYECLGGLTALSLRDEIAGNGVRAIQSHFAPIIPPFIRDRSPGPDVELILVEFDSREFKRLLL